MLHYQQYQHKVTDKESHNDQVHVASHLGSGQMTAEKKLTSRICVACEDVLCSCH